VAFGSDNGLPRLSHLDGCAVAEVNEGHMAVRDRHWALRWNIFHTTAALAVAAVQASGPAGFHRGSVLFVASTEIEEISKNHGKTSWIARMRESSRIALVRCKGSIVF
jgi:hypothetical protein